MSKNEKKLTQKQKNIIAAASSLFAENGYAATSTSEIAQKAGVAEGTIFRHYKNKKELLISIVTPMMVEFIAPILKDDIYKVIDQEFVHFEDFIKAMIQNRIHFMKNNITLLRILMQELPFHPELKEQFITHIGKDIFAKVKKVIIYYQDKGQIVADLPPATILRSLASNIISYILFRYIILPEAEWDDEQEVEHLIRMLKHGVSPN